MPTNEPIKPCPRCDCTYAQAISFMDCFYVFCPNCGLKGPKSEPGKHGMDILATKNHAVANWNAIKLDI